MPYRLVTFDTVTLPTYYREGDSVVGTAETDDDYIRLAGGATWDARKGERALPFRARYTMDCMLLGSSTSDLQTQESALYAKAGVKGTLTRQNEAGSSQTITARLSIPEVPERIGGKLARPMRLVFDIDTPGWLGANRNDSLSTFNDGPYTSTDTMENDGDMPFRWPVLTVTADDPLATFTFLAGPDSAGRHWHWTWSGLLVTDKQLVINCGTCQVTNDGAADYGITLAADHNQNELVSVPPGGLDFQVEVTFDESSSQNFYPPAVSWTSYDVHR